MSDNDKLLESPEELKKKIEYDEQMRKIHEEVVKKINDYRNTMNYMAADAPIEVLCLPKSIEKLLFDSGLLRIYDLFDRDFTKIKGLDIVRTRELTTSLDKFFSML